MPCGEYCLLCGCCCRYDLLTPAIPLRASVRLARLHLCAVINAINDYVLDGADALRDFISRSKHEWNDDTLWQVGCWHG